MSQEVTVNVDLVVVGSGLFGLTVAERCARELGLRVLVIDRRDHIGGNAYSEVEPQTGIEVHRYGAHLFHTSNERVWEYVNRFTAFTGYRHRVFSIFKGRVYPMPINLGTICEYFGRPCRPDEARALIAEQAAEVDRRRAQPGGEGDLADRPAALRGVHPRLHRQAVADRPARAARRDHHPAAGPLHLRQPLLQRPYEGLPVDGYTAWLERMADHPRIEVRLAPTSSILDRRRGQRPGRLHRAAGPLLRQRRRRAGLAHPRLRARGPARPATSRARRS